VGKVRDRPRSTNPGALKRWIPALVLVSIMALVFAVGWHRHLTLENIAAHRASLRAFLADHAVLAPLAYAAVYAATVALSVPGALVLTLTGGLLFGCLLGGLLAVIAATIGATVVFLIAKTSSETLVDQAGPWLVKLRQGFRKNALSYLLFLRLVPAFPFWLVNLAPAILGVPIGTFVLGTLLGIIPGSFAFASVGAGLDSILTAAEAEHARCIAEKGAANCKLSIQAASLVTPELVLAFCLLGVIALIPVVLKKWRSRDATT
jgi:uncharacterized membrane protein YdjX (TVP38/TMEM64 family)